MPPRLPPISVDIWSDVVCPWCYIGKRRFERAIASLAGEIEVDVTYHAFQLDPAAPPGTSEPLIEAYARKFGGLERAQQMIDRVTSIAAGDGIEFHLDRARRANTRLAHRLIALAATNALDVAQDHLEERLMAAYFVDGLDIGDPETLADRAGELGTNRDRVLALLDSDAGVAEVEADLLAARRLELTGVPAYVIERRWTIPGAQDSDTFVTVLRRVDERRRAGLAADGDV
jgi:predicted DsbA family dithiol-disulfide isomerase